jgi:hypothetical protein
LCTLALDIRGKIQWSDICPGLSIRFKQNKNPPDLLGTHEGLESLGSTKVVLGDGIPSGGVMQDGSFLMFVIHLFFLLTRC